VRLLAIDPGNEESAWVYYDMRIGGPRHFDSFGKVDNGRLLARLHQFSSWGVHALAIEMVASYGMPVGREVFETCVWIGRFVERWKGTHQFVYRRDVKLHLCNSARAKDANVRQALIDRYGGKEMAVGKKATPGPLYGISGDCWSALAVAITAAETSTPSSKRGGS
jgi:hypothetical protein